MKSRAPDTGAGLAFPIQVASRAAFGTQHAEAIAVEPHRTLHLAKDIRRKAATQKLEDQTEPLAYAVIRPGKGL